MSIILSTKDNAGFEKLARWAGVMDNIKANVPRTAYKGVVSLWIGSSKLHLVPKGFCITDERVKLLFLFLYL